MYTSPSPTAEYPDAPHVSEIPSENGVCQACLRSPAARLVAVKQTGMLFVRRSAAYSAVLCQSCGTSMFREVQAHNLAFGWWGLISFITNFFTLASNCNRYRRHRMIGPSAEMPLRPGLNPGRPVWKRPQMIIPVALVALAVVAGIGSAGREKVRELHAGQCIDVPAAGHFSDVKLVPCAQPHDAEVAGVLRAADTSPTTDTGEACAQLAADHVLLSRASDVELHTFEPVSASGTSGRAPRAGITAICVLSGINDADLTGHVTG